MVREDVERLIAFLAVAREQSFTRAAAQLGVSQSALSQTVKGLEERLGLRLLARTTRSVAPTDAGERLLRTSAPISMGSSGPGHPHRAPRDARRHRPHHGGRVRGPLRPVAGDEGVLSDYPDIIVEIVVDYGLTDIVAERYDAGVRLGGIVAKDMIAVPIGPDMRMAIVGAPSYFAKRPPPRTPQDLTDHTCINLRLPTHGGLYAWEFEGAGANCVCGSKASSCSTPSQ